MSTIVMISATTASAANAMNAISDPDSTHDQKLAAAKALGSSKDPFALDALIKVLDTRDEALRDAALASIHKLDGANKLAARLVDAKQPERSKQLAARGLRYLRDDSTVPSLVLALSDASGAVRADAAFALSMFGGDAAEASLIKALDDENKDVRYYAADALGSVKGPAAAAALEKRLSLEPDSTVQHSLKAAIARHSR